MKWFGANRFRAILLFIVGLLLYSNTIGHDYAWDDAIVITENSRVQQGLQNVSQLFENIHSNKTEYRYGYRPITLLSFAVEVQVFGLNPQVSHFTNALLYGILCAVIFLCLIRIFPAANLSLTLFIAVLLFTVHPLHTEVVANIKSRDEILSLLFGILSLTCFNQYLNSSKFWSLVVSLVLLVLAFLCKENAITFVAVMVLLGYYRFGMSRVRRILPSVGLMMFAFCLLMGVRLFVHSESFLQQDDQELLSKGVFHHDGFVGNPLFDVQNDKMHLLANTFHLFWRYVKQFFVPWPLLHDYSYYQIKVVSWSNWITYLGVLVFAIFFGASIWHLRKRTLAGFGLGFFLITLSVYINFFVLGPDMYAERFMFAPSLGLCLVFADFLGNLNLPRGFRNVLFGGLVILFSVLVIIRNADWKDNDTLFEADIPYLDGCVRAQYNYALLNHRKYYNATESGKAEFRSRALEGYEKVVGMTDRLFVAYMDLGAAYMEFGYPDKAFEVFTEASVGYGYLSVPWVQLGKYYMSFGDYENAVLNFEKAIERGEMNSDFYYLLGLCQFNVGKHDDALATLEKGEALGVSSSAYYSLMARLYANLLDYESAESALYRGLKLYPNDSGLKQMLKAIELAKVTQGSK